jgi:hypothetical protein
VEVFLEDGEKVIENNEGKYFFYKVGEPISETETKDEKRKNKNVKNSFTEPPSKPKIYQKPPIETPPQKTYVTREMVKQSTAIPHEKVKAPEMTSPKEYTTDTATIFGKPQIEIDPDLKVCSYCNSKIKKMWSTCPICGKTL